MIAPDQSHREPPRDGDPWSPSLAARRNADDIDGIARAARCASSILRTLVRESRPGASTADLDASARGMIARAGAEALFLGYRDEAGPPFPGAICACINDEVVHAPPSARRLAPGDVLTLDLGLRLDGWCADTARTVRIPGEPPDPEADALVSAVERVLETAIAMIAPRVRWSTIALAMESAAAAASCGIVTQYIGHGIGRRLHEPPRAPAFWTGYDGPDFTLQPGMVLAIEPILTRPAPATGFRTPVLLAEDGWTVRTADGSLAAHAEDMVVVTETGGTVLTRRGNP